MVTKFSLTVAGHRVHDHPTLYPQHDTERPLLAALQAHDAGLSFDDIIQSVPGKIFEVLQSMAVGMAMGLLNAEPSPQQQELNSGTDRDTGLGHGRW